MGEFSFNASKVYLLTYKSIEYFGTVVKITARQKLIRV